MARSPNDRRRGSRPHNREQARSDINRRKERDFKRELAEKSSASGEAQYTPLQKRAVENLLSGIGTPEPKPLVPDDFQIEALEAIETRGRSGHRADRQRQNLDCARRNPATAEQRANAPGTRRL